MKFVLFSASAGILQTITFTVFTELPERLFSYELPYWVCYLSALIVSVLYNFTVNRRFTFKSATNIPIAMLKVAAYYCVFTPLSTYLGKFFTDLGINDYIVFGCTMLSNLVTEFLYCRFVVYRNSINTNDLAKKQEENSKDKESEDIMKIN